MSTWIIPYVDQPLDFWAEIHDRFAGDIREVYFPTPAGAFASGRSPQPERFLDAFLRGAPLARSVLINPIVLPQPVEIVAPAVVDTLRRLQGEHGVQSVTVAHPGLARAIKDALPGYYVTASVLMGICSPAQALVVRDFVDAITPDTRLVRDLAGLRRLRAAFTGEIRLIVNEACLPSCPFRTQHFYEMAYTGSFPRSLCARTLQERPWLRLTGAWVLPRHLSHYDGLYDTLKLAGRVTLRDPARYRAVLGAYIGRAPIRPCDIGGGPASVTAPFDVSDEWFNFVLHCDKQCSSCAVCRDYYARLNPREEREWATT